MGANQVGRNHAGLRKRMSLFARLRAAGRAMPAAAAELADAEIQEERATRLRETIAELAAKEAPPKSLADEVNARLGEIDAELEDMKRSVVGRFDAIPFVSLRAAIPRSVETHRKEVVALLEVLLSDREALLERLPQVEYLITILATDEDEGRRNIQHDPVSLTPLLENFTVESLEPSEAEAIAMELYQAATLDSDSENFSEVLRTLRARKQELGLGCLCPVVLRAVVTYNARMFNSVESIAEASRASDSILEDELEMLDESVDSLESADDQEFVEPIEDETSEPATEDAGAVPTDPPVAVEPEGEGGPVSVFDSPAIDSVIEAMRTRVQGGQVGRRGPQERIAVILDQGSLEALESEAILAESRTPEQDIVARTTVVGLMLRDLGPLQDSLEQLGVSQEQLSDQWVRELNETFGQMLSDMLADPKAYEMTSRLSGIKTKHLFKPFKALNSPSGPTPAQMGFDVGTREMRAAARAAASESSDPRARVRSVRGVAQKGSSAGVGLGGNRKKIIAAAALVAVAVGLTLSNVVGIMPTDVTTVKPAALRVTSPYLSSAYRNEKGRGPLMIGRVDSLFVELPIEEKIEAAEEMVENFEIQGINEAMFYDDRGTMQVQYAAGELFRPRLGDRSTGHRPGEAAVRRTLSGERLDELEAEDGDSNDDGWGDF